MSEEPPTDMAINQESPRRIKAPKPIIRSMAFLAVLGMIALGLMLLPRPALYYPHVVIDAGGTIALDFLLHPRADQSSCQSAATNIASTITANCSECRTREVTCIKNPPKALRGRFDEGPLPVPSARMPNGIVTYSAPQPAFALNACEESERQAAVRGDQSKVACYAAGSPRPHTSFEQSKAQAGHNTFTLLLGLIGILLASIVVTILFTRNRSVRQTPAESAIAIHPTTEKFALAGIDFLLLMVTFLAFAWPENDDIQHWGRVERSTVIGHGIVVTVTICWFWILLEHYARRRPFWDELREAWRVLGVMAMVSGALAFIAGLETGRFNHLFVWMVNFLLLPLGRAAVRQILDDLSLWRRPAVIIGCGENAREAWLAIRAEGNMGYRLLGFVNPACDKEDGAAVEIKGEHFPIYKASKMYSWPSSVQIFVALDSLTNEEGQSILNRLVATRPNIHVIPSLRGLPLLGTQASHFFSHEVLLLTVRNNLSRLTLRLTKRTFDIVVASILLIIISPLMAYVAWRIWCDDGGPVIFRQPRLAKGTGQFGFLKFRSMVNNADMVLAKWRETNSPEWQEYFANNFKLKNDPRVLGVGKWIRSTSIDELPQLINVLRGEMSLVGPRPLLARELPDYGDSIHFYRQVWPGITGLWQISGRSETTFSDRANLDEWYVRNWSLWYDIAILFKTIDVVFNKRGAH